MLTNSFLTLAWVFCLPKSVLTLKNLNFTYNLFIPFPHWRTYSGQHHVPPDNNFLPISWHPQTKLTGTWQSFINWEHAKCTSLFNGKFDAKAKWGKLHWPALGHFKECYILICCQVSRWWADSHQSPAAIFEGRRHPPLTHHRPPGPTPKHKQMQSCWYRWTSGKKYSKPPVFIEEKNDRTGQLGHCV